jgi:DNA-binding transcriptional LysR family regulator
MAACNLRSGDLIEILPEYRYVELGIYVVHPSRKHLPSKARVLIGFLTERFASPWNN